ncbi:lysozyme inhibitor LprI family protein [Methylobacterium sp. 77]|uniref:lysozyme inhibitor LprI family protein n=1 Tax=Methylobacterium sp. 77 TaxID=1101192 RepID=UPI001FD9FB97|nr:lysozyme inhibitor LprI family protein [Methylobacterium sp. 77]
MAALALSFGTGVVAQTDTGRQASSDLALIEQCIALAKGDAGGSACIGRVSKPCIDTPDGSSTMGMNACYSREIAAWDTLLNRIYKDASGAMDENGSIYLRDTQRLWLSFRQKACEWPAQVYPNGTIRGPLSGECMQIETARRALDLGRIKAALTEQ